MRADGTIGLAGNLGRRQSIPSRHIRMSGATLPAALMAASTALLMAIGLLSRPAQGAGPAWSASCRFASASIIARHRLKPSDAPKQSVCAANPPDTAAKPGFVYQLSGSADAHIPGAMMTSLSHHLIYQVFCYRAQNIAFPWPQKALSPYAKMGKNNLLPDTRWPFLRQYHHFFLRWHRHMARIGQSKKRKNGHLPSRHVPGLIDRSPSRASTDKRELVELVGSRR